MVFAMGTTKEDEAGGGLTADGTATVAVASDQSPACKVNGTSREAAPVAYFGVALGTGMTLCDDDELPLVFVDRNLALRCVKKYRGARFKAFSSREEAAAFSIQPAVAPVETTDSSESTAAALVGEKSSNYRAPKSQDLVQLRKAIEAGDANFFRQNVWSNPRYLVGSGDTPTILQEGYRYNALHVSCAKGQPELVRLLLETLQDPHFLELLYPDDSSDVRTRRTAFLLDLYLNTPDKGRCETPLHFACKFGCFEAVELLVALPECDRSRLNKEGQTPQQIICDRLPSASAELRRRIDSLFEERVFVPVLRSEDNSMAPTIGEPFSPEASPMRGSPVTSPRDSSLSVMAAAGPMSPTEARSMYRQWKTPKRRSIGLKSPVPPMDNMRLADIEKGLECIGRGLAKEMRVPWSEYWPFLGCWCNLASPEGLEKLENHLRSRRSQVVSERWSLENSPAASDEQSLFSPISQLCEALGELRLDPPLEKSWGGGQDGHHLSAKLPRTPNGTTSLSKGPAWRPLCGGSNSAQGGPLAAQRLAKVLCDWALAHDTGPEPEADLALQLADQVLHELGRLERSQGKGQLWQLHPWLAREVHLLLQDSLEAAEREGLLRVLRAHLPHWAPSPPSTDDEDDGTEPSDAGRRYRQPSSRRRGRALKRHLQCVLRYLCALLDDGCADVEPFHCLCSQRTAGLETAFLRDCQAQPVEEEEEEVFFTPPTSPCSSSGPSPQAHTPDEGPMFFIQGSQPSKVDLDVLRAIEPHLLEPNALDPLVYPCVHQWMQFVRSFPPETTSRWPSPSTTNLRHASRTVLFPDSPRSNGDSRLEGCRTPVREPPQLLRSRALQWNSPEHL
ncbi:hypothetical protein V5799_021507 [Amblyomma americanum]|uniref:Ankyrin repeat and LEM domain-containing protein 2 n=1 Tax=Amblyomma americanum TaxID=6943 RepID=A0AAQ4FN33_AMBAM